MADYTIGIPTEKVTLPLGTRAVQLPVTDVVTLINTSSKYVRYELHPFLRTFGQPVRRRHANAIDRPALVGNRLWN